jgi:hypothetical protein
MSTLIRSAVVLVMFTAAAANAGINCIALWMEPNATSIRSSESIPYVVMELNGADWRGEVTHHPDLKVVSSNEKIVAVDQKAARLVGKVPGHVEIRVSFGECTSIAVVGVVSKSK